METVLFLLAAVALLGSPGPGIAALVAAGKDRGVARSLPFYGGMQVGLAVAAGLSAAGLASLLTALPGMTLAMGVAATAYLLYLAWRIATAPVGQADEGQNAAWRPAGGFLLGIANPKAYLAFLSLMGAYTLVAAAPLADAALKWLLCVIVMILVDLAWLWLGAVIGTLRWGPAAERSFNLAMGAIIVLAALLALA